MIQYRQGFFIRAVLATAIISFYPLSAGAAEHIKCAECGMLVDQEAPFSSKIVAKDHTQYFCDIGDLLIYLRENKLGPARAWVKDYRSGEWIEAAQAFYVREPMRFITPMGWGVASFRERKEAADFGEPSDITSITRRLK